MIKIEVIGHLGANVEIKNADGKQFATCRIAHTDKFTDAQGVVHSTTQWVDVIINAQSKVLPYLVTGTQVFVRGDANLRVYSSAKDKCMKAGLTIRANEILLLSSKPKSDEQTKESTNAAPTTNQDNTTDAPF